MSLEITVRCVGCECTNHNPEVQIQVVPGFALSHNKGNYGICYDCLAKIHATTHRLSKNNDAYLHETLCARGNRLDRTQNEAAITFAKKVLQESAV